MTTPRALIVRAPGTNCDQETAFVFARCGAVARIVHLSELHDHPALFDDHHILVFPGGFAHGDYISAGKIWAAEMEQQFSEELLRFLNAGKLTLGICNGFQAMVKMKLLPGPFGEGPQRVSLVDNDSNRYEDRWVYLKASSRRCVYVDPDTMLFLPMAHGEGKFVVRDERTLHELEQNDQIVFRYVHRDGSEASYPANPSGTTRGIAAICDRTGRVMGMMPHPERHFLPTHHPRWTREGLKEAGDGAMIFRNAVEYIRSKL